MRAKKWWLAGLIVLILIIFGVVGWIWLHKSTPLVEVLPVDNISAKRDELLSLTNQARQTASLSALEDSLELERAAQAKANDMIARNYWGHLGPDETTPWSWLNKEKYDYKHAGENLAYGFSTDQKVIDGWLKSPEHRANLLGDYTQVGFGLSRGQHYQGGANTVVVAMYATPR